MVAGIKIKNAERAAERDSVRDLLRRTFEVHSGVGAAFAQLYDQVLETSVRSRVALLDGQVVGHALLALRTFDLAGVVFRGGIVAMVAVDARVQGQGIGRALIRDVDVLAREENLAMLQVAGDPRLYTKFGFIPAYEEVVATAVIDPQRHSDLGLRVATEDDAAMLARISLAEQAMGAVVADETRWQWVLKTKHPKGLLQCNERLVGLCAEYDVCLIWKDLGYVRMCGTGETLVIYEAGYLGQEAHGLLKACLTWGQKKGCRVVRAYLPSNHGLVDAFKAYGASLDLHEDHELHAKILDVPLVLSQMTDVFSERVGASSQQKRLGLSVGDVQFEVTCGDGVQIQEVDAVGHVHWHLAVSEAALIRALWGVAPLYDPEGDPALDALLMRLFPKMCPFFALADSL